jgi:hypothetical protein
MRKNRLDLRKSRGEKVQNAKAAASPKRANPATPESLVVPGKKVFRPVEIHGEALSDTIGRERR